MPRAKVNGIELAYETYGDGYPLVLTHGYLASKEMWNGQIGPFSERYRVVVYDVRGHGESEAPPVDDAGYTMETLVDDLRGLLAHLGIEQAHVGGLSLGGMVAMRFALASPDMVRTLLLCDTSPGMGTEGLWAQNRQLMETMVRSQGVGPLVRMFYEQRRASGTGGTIPATNAGIQAFVDGLARVSPDGFLGIARAAGDAPSVLERLGEITAPTLILTGDMDFFKQASEEMHQQMPGARFVTIRDAGHGTCLWQPEQFTTAVLDFLADAEAGRPVAAEIVR